MTDFPRVAFVDAPTTDAAVRFDFNTAGDWPDESTYPGHDAFSLGNPSLQGDIDAAGVEYGTRELSFTVLIKGAKANATAQMSALARELLRQRNWLLFQLSAFSKPVWFKTYRTAPKALSFEYVQDTSDGSTDLWSLSVSLDADPFAYGELVTVGPATINNDPAAGSNPLSYVLPDILGDAPAPLSMSFVPSAALGGNVLAIASAASSETGAWGTAEAPSFKQYGTSDGGSAANGTATTVTAAGWSGGSARRVNFDATPTTLQVRYFLPITWAAGTFKVLVRMAASDASSTFGVQGAVNRPFGAEQTFGGSVLSYWVDLGQVTVPFGQPRGLPLSEQLGTLTASLQVLARRISGAGTLVLDTVAVVPVDLAKGSETRFLVPGFVGVNGPDTNNVTYVDAEAENLSLLSAAPTVAHAYADSDRTLAGQVPQVLPDRANTVVLFQALPSPTGTGDAIARTAAVTFYYYPRYLYLPGA